MTPSALQTFLARRSDPRLYLPGQGRSAAQKISRITDQYFCSRLDELKLASVQGLTLAAVGGYGRQEQFLKSDIDLLILIDSSHEQQAEQTVARLLHPLWDSGLDLGHGVRSISQCLELACQDHHVLTSLVDVRYICGDRNLYAALSRALKPLFRDEGTRLLHSLARSKDSRWHLLGSDYFMEPDLKDDPGGLRDYNLVVWTEKIFQYIQPEPDLPFWGKDSRSFYQAVDFLFDLRSGLHSMNRTKNDRLYLDLQPEAARIMGFHELGGKSGVEVFLEELFTRQSRIMEQAQVAVDLILARQDRHSSSRNRKKLFPVQDQQLIQQQNSKLWLSSRADLEKNPELIPEIFRSGVQTGLDISGPSLVGIRRFLETAGLSPVIKRAVQDVFLEIVMQDTPGRWLRLMFRSGLLGFVLPELEKKWFFVQFDGVHIYPLGEHTLHVLDNIAGLDGKKGFLKEELHSYAFFPALRLAALVHDLGKGEGDHCQTGARLAEQVLKAWGIAEEVLEDTVFLVRNHLLMVGTALKRDLDEEGVVADFVQEVGSLDRLGQLTLLCYADARATGPGVWNNWQENLVRSLYFRAARLMKHTILGGHHAGHRMAVVRDKVRSDRDYNQFWEEMLQAMPYRYLLRVPIPEIIRHIRVVEKFTAINANPDQAGNDPGFILLTDKPGPGSYGYWSLTLVTRDRPGLLTRIAAALAMNQVKIYSAGLFTWDNGLVVDMLKVSPPADPLYPVQAWQEVRQDLKGLISGQDDVRQFCDRIRKTAVAGSRYRVKVDNDSSDFYTLIEVDAPDHPCLTWLLSACLADQGVDISFALIAASMDQSSHVFYVRDQSGMKLDKDRKTLGAVLYSSIKSLFL
ncbi:HD domain-containing protein [Desulfonatronovibrio hydrogenovorans]|uniref:[protein-PII] uridylyltransferase family protein n=1 Tax=Desulfonatronovibrio hydrogenovorans TaxID=53245 RepID=UPI000490419A|nr:HD domain-containing protein [Desulfonatronovibrio hydrogenovorans]